MEARCISLARAVATCVPTLSSTRVSGACASMCGPSAIVPITARSPIRSIFRVDGADQQRSPRYQRGQCSEAKAVDLVRADISSRRMVAVFDAVSPSPPAPRCSGGRSRRIFHGQSRRERRDPGHSRRGCCHLPPGAASSIRKSPGSSVSGAAPTRLISVSARSRLVASLATMFASTARRQGEPLRDDRCARCSNGVGSAAPGRRPRDRSPSHRPARFPRSARHVLWPARDRAVGERRSSAASPAWKPTTSRKRIQQSAIAATNTARRHEHGVQRLALRPRRLADPRLPRSASRARLQPASTTTSKNG